MDRTGEEHLKLLGLQSSKFGSTNSSVHFYHRGVENRNSGKAILVLIHGYPQSAYMWRHIVKRLPEDIPLFIPDIPGYGQSSPITNGPHDKRTVGKVILLALKSLIPSSTSTTKIIIAGHDRGARIAHRLAVDMAPDQTIDNLVLQGTILIDIVPTLVQWNSFSNSRISSGNFHWPFLANVEIATAMIAAQGGSTFCQTLLNRWSGRSASGKANMMSDNATEVYCNYFNNPDVVKASCEDYKAGANEDVDEQKKDQAVGKKIQGKTLVIHSKDYLGSRFDVGEVWKDWVASGANFSFQSVGGGFGHFLCEEAPDEIAPMIEKFFLSSERI